MVRRGLLDLFLYKVYILGGWGGGGGPCELNRDLSLLLLAGWAPFAQGSIPAAATTPPPLISWHPRLPETSIRYKQKNLEVGESPLPSSPPNQRPPDTSSI